ncbi:MAG: hypothetical protein ACREF9_14000, partial [Opitutaceae bacterium]
MSEPGHNLPPPERRSALDWPSETGSNAALLDELRRRSRQRRRRHATVGAVAATMLCLVSISLFRRDGPFTFTLPFTPTMAGRAAVTVPQRQALPDGSRAELREGAEIRVDFGQTERAVQLVRGEAHF